MVEEGQKISTQTSDFHIPSGQLSAPSAKFAGTKEAFIEIMRSHSSDIAFINKYVKNRTIMAKALNQIGNEGMDFVGMEHPFKINNNMADRGDTAFDGSSVVEINTKRFGLPEEFQNDLAEMAHRVFHEKRHVYQNIQRSLGFGENSLEPLELYSSDLAEGSVNKIGGTQQQFYDYLKGNQYDYYAAQDGRFPRNISEYDIEYGMNVSQNQANYIEKGSKYWTQFVEQDAEQIAGLACGREVEKIIKTVDVDPSKISLIAKGAYCAENLGIDFDIIMRNSPENINQVFLELFE